MEKQVNERDIAFGILIEMEKDERKKQLGVKGALERLDYLDARSKAFIKYLSDGVIERMLTLDYIIDQYSKTPVEKMDSPIKCIIRMGTFQIMYMDNVPDSAAVNESVKLAIMHGFKGLKGFVNGVLRNIARNKEDIKWPNPGNTTETRAYYLSIKYSQPQWLAEMWIEQCGVEKTLHAFKFFLETRPVTIRFSKRLGGEEVRDLIAKMKTANEGRIKLIPSGILPYALNMYHTDNLRYIPGFDEGAWMVQDISSMLVGEIADIKKNQTILDVCAAPGGKSIHAADMMRGTGKVISRDISENKCMIIKENARRMKVDNMEVRQGDASRHEERLENIADVLYCDLPCSGLGVIGRKPDIKLNMDPLSILSLQKKQREILENVWNYVKPGGTLIYSTCTMSKAENEDNVKWILEKLPFEAVDITERLPEKMKECPTAEKGYIQLAPGEYDTDGFFIAKFRRKE
ncbi:MAG: 16S rRNA (cytosine(967)-C(5))-methyltransferase RsmB [Butyrivibrio sp.]|nr:16S rRNA (cytosine(967)-C(5))-methyltransferase RsmB [Butyrivibrio sp.]